MLQRAEEVLDRLGLVRIGTEVLKAAARLEPTNGRSLAAIHLATALSLGEQLHGIVAYDSRLAEAAEANGIEVMAPG